MSNLESIKNTSIPCDHIHLTSIDINKYRESLTDIVIAPFDITKSKGIGYNFSLSEMVFSITRNRLVPICRETNETYFYLKPRETVLALSYEYIKVNDTIAGTFHSRVRTTAQGLGSISTTLDPGWNGMLLFSLNNPTKKRIKVVLSSRIDGITKTQPISTLITWRIINNNSKQVDLCLDNPPMRTDIWSELASKSLKLFSNRRYQKFRNLVNDIACFKPMHSQEVAWKNDLSTLLTDLYSAFFVEKSDKAVKTILCRIKDFNDLPTELEKRLDALFYIINDTDSTQIDIFSLNVDTFNSSQCEDYENKIQLAKREVNYQELCDHVNQIHNLISKKVPTSWKTNFWAHFWNRLLKSMDGIVATIILFLIFFNTNIINVAEFGEKILITLVPTAVSIILTIVVPRNE